MRPLFPQAALKVRAASFTAPASHLTNVRRKSNTCRMPNCVTKGATDRAGTDVRFTPKSGHSGLTTSLDLFALAVRANRAFRIRQKARPYRARELRGQASARPRAYKSHVHATKRALARLVSKNDAAPQMRVPSISNAANHRNRCYDSRCYNNRGRCDYDGPVRATMSIRTTVKAGTTSALSTGAVDGDE